MPRKKTEFPLVRKNYNSFPWIDEYVKFGAKQAGMSESEYIRLSCCVSWTLASAVMLGKKPPYTMTGLVFEFKRVLASGCRKKIKAFVEKIYSQSKEFMEERMVRGNLSVLMVFKILSSSKVLLLT